MSTQPVSHEAAIRALVEATAAAIRNKDVDGAAAAYADNVLLFDLITPLQTRGKAALRERLGQWFAQFDGPLKFTVDQLNVTAGAGAAFCHSINSVDGLLKSGERLNMSWRATICFERAGGRWIATHSHSSVPFDMVTGKAAMGAEN